MSTHLGCQKIQANVALCQKLDAQIQRCANRTDSQVFVLIQIHSAEARDFWSSVDRRQYTHRLRQFLDKADRESARHISASQDESSGESDQSDARLTEVTSRRRKNMSSLTC